MTFLFVFALTGLVVWALSGVLVHYQTERAIDRMHRARLLYAWNKGCIKAERMVQTARPTTFAMVRRYIDNLERVEIALAGGVEINTDRYYRLRQTLQQRFYLRAVA